MPELVTTGLNLEKTDSFNLDGLDLEKARPEVTVRRIAGRFAHTVKQTPGLMSKMSRSFLEVEDIDALDEKPSLFTGFAGFRPTIPMISEMEQFLNILKGDKRTAIDDVYEQMNMPAKTRVNEKANEYAEIYPDREAFKKAVIEEKKAERKDTIEQMKSFEQQFEMPEKYKESSGFLEDIAGGLGTSVASMGSAIAGTALGGPGTGFLFSTAMAYSQMHGYKIQELEDIGGVSPDDKLKAAIFSGATQAPLESISNLFMISKVMKLNGTWAKFLVSTLQAGAGEAATEFVQQYPDTYASIMALNPDLTGSERLAFMTDNIGETTGEALYAAAVGGAAGALTVGVGGGGKIATVAMLNKLVSPKQKAINEAKAARFEQLATKFDKDGITESEAVELREMVNATETTEVEEIVKAVKKSLVFQEPIKSETRDTVIKSVRESGKFTDEQVDSYATIWDGIARNWAELEPDRKPEQWYDEWLSEFNAGEFIEAANRVYQIQGYDAEYRTSIMRGEAEERRLDKSPDKAFIFESNKIPKNAKTVTIYRSAPGDIRPGDYAGLNKGTAELHLRKPTDKVWEKEVLVSDLIQGADQYEVIYAPKDKIDEKLTFQKDKRGAMENLFNDSPKIMHAFEDADPSTPIHETGHTLLEMMFQGGHEDYLIAAEWAGVEHDRAMQGTKKWTKEELEKFAKGFEVYLMEGKAPTSRLAEVFRQLKTWLLEVYKSVKALGIELDDNIREVFDRWVSTESERRDDPILEVPEWLMADDIKADMKRRDLTEDASFEDMQAEARKRVLGALKAKRSKLEKKLEKEFRKEAREMVNENPIYEMLADVKKRGGLNYGQLVNDFGVGYLEDIVKRLPGIVNKNGVPIDSFAREYGYDTADAMMQAVLNTPTKQQAEEYHYNDLWRGYEVMLEHENIMAYEDVVEEEINILNEMLGEKPKARKELKGIIRKQTGQIKDQEYQELKDGIRRDVTLAKKAFSAGKKDAAKQQLEKTKKRLQALRGRVKVRDTRRKIDKRMQRIWKSKLLPEYKAQITQILSVYYNIPKSYMVQPEMSLDVFLAEKEEDNDANVKAIRFAMENLPEQRRNAKGYRVPLTLEEKQAMMQPVLSLNHMGRTEKILLTEKEKIDLDERVLELTTRGYEVFGQPEESEDVILLREKVGWFKKLSEKSRTYIAMTGKLEFMFDVLDGGVLGGPNSKLFEKSATALDQELILGKEYLNKIQGVFKSVKKVKNWANKIHKIEGLEQSVTKEQMFMVTLQSASKSGRNALMTGNKFTEQHIDAIADKIKEQGEWHMIEGVWDVFESLYPMLNNVHKKLTGINLPRVEGKYFPLKYDPQLSRQAGQFEQRAAERDLFHAAYTRPHVEAGSRIARVAGRKPPVLLSLNVINMKLTEFIHDVTHQLPVRDLQKVLAHEKYRAMVDNTLGSEYYDQMMPWLAHVAKPKMEYSPGAQFVNKARNNATIVALGLKVSVSLKQAGSITQTVDELNLMTGSKTKGMWLTAKAVSDFYRDRKQMVDFIRESSPLMDNRKKNWNRELMEFYNATDVKNFGGSFAARDAFFWMIQAVDQAVTFPSWYAGYLHGMDVYHGDHSQAVKVADKVVRKTQPVASPSDLSMFQRGGKKRTELLKWGTMFYTHFANFQNRMWQTKQLHKLGKIDRVEAYASYWWILIAPGLLGGALGRRELPKGWDWLKDVIGYRLAGLPVIRDVVGPMITGYDYSMTPVARAFETPARIVKIATSKGKEKAARLFKETARLAGYIFGLPTDQALVTMDGVIDLMSGETNKPQRLFFRKPYKEKKTARRSL